MEGAQRTYTPMYPKPGQVKKKPESVRVLKDGREILNMLTKQGRDEYIRRRRVAWESQTEVVGKRTIHICSICKQELLWKDATSDHKRSRGMGGGTRDDRQENIGAAHFLCNQQKGSTIDPDIVEAI
jgi:hypothetical protein